MLIEEACDGGTEYIDDDKTPVRSPGFGRRPRYPKNAYCKWEIVAPHADDVSLSIAKNNHNHDYDNIQQK